MTSPWESDGEWLRCQLHAHTTNSDGEPTPEGLVEHYARAGFDVLAITDHWHITPFAHEGILVIPSAELSGAIEGELEEADVLAYGIDELPEARERFPSIAAAASWIVAQGGVAYLAHPYWSGLSAQHYLGAPPCRASSLQRRLRAAAGQRPLGRALGRHPAARPRVPRHRDRRLALRRTGPSTRVDDGPRARAHARRPCWRRCAAALLRQSGPEIRDVRVAGDGVDVRCSPARSVALRSGRWDGCKVNAAPHGMNWRGR